MSVTTAEAARPPPAAARTRLLLEGPIVSTLFWLGMRRNLGRVS